MNKTSAVETKPCGCVWRYWFLGREQLVACSVDHTQARRPTACWPNPNVKVLTDASERTND